MTHFAYLCFAGLWLLLLGAQGGVLWLMRVQIWAQPSCCLWIMLTGGTEYPTAKWQLHDSCITL